MTTTITSKLEAALADAHVTIICQPEDIPVRGNAMASGDDDIDKGVEDQILADLEQTKWAWCYVVVMVTMVVGNVTFVGRDTLGGCSYASEEDFRKGDYFTDMREMAKSSIRDQVDAAQSLAD